METRRLRVLFVDDEGPNLSTVRRLYRRDFDIETAGSVRQAIAVMEHAEVDVLITDCAMPGTNGLDLLRWAKAERPHIGRILVTAHVDLADLQAAIDEERLASVLFKPIDAATLRAEVIRRAPAARPPDGG